MTYQQVLEQVKTFRNPSKDKLIKNNTRLYLDGNTVKLKLHSTDIITWLPDGQIILNTGGWQTVTTKQRMNEFLPQHVYIRQKNDNWYVDVNNISLEYYDGFIIKNSLNMVMDSFRSA